MLGSGIIPASNRNMSSAVTLCTADHLTALGRVLATYGMTIAEVQRDVEIPGSYWGDSEAGLVGNTLYVRPDTPLHSALHDA